MDLNHERIVVIGGSSGMGLATARAAAQAGANVTIAARDQKQLDSALAELPSGCEAVQTDVTREDEIAALFDHVGTLDHLVYTASAGPAPQPLTELDLDGARQGFDVIYWGVIAAVKHAAPRIRQDGSITLTSGTLGVRPVPGFALASAGTSAIEGLARGLARDLAPVRVNAIRPGTVRTPMYDTIPEEHREALFTAVRERNLTHSIGEPEQIAQSHLYLMTNSYVTGTVLTVDGGGLLN
ncbi:SDR family oxidoreductase [Streptomyces sp. NPDC051546]|uniref:SDR family oxidoreductase n=1 Tax=Streptomyces sp. NPDC051546 TaxID=3365655 RepID=UPI0037930487